MQVTMPQEVGEWIFWAMMFNVVFFFVLTIAIIVMHFLMPSAVLDKYFKPPYFRDMERLLFTGFPYAPMRTIMLMRAISYPNSGKKRGITEANMLVPAWYRMISKMLVISIVASFSFWVFFVVCGGLIFLT